MNPFEAAGNIASKPMTSLRKILPSGVGNKLNNVYNRNVNNRTSATYYDSPDKIKGISGADVLAPTEGPPPNEIISIHFLSNGTSCVYLGKDVVPFVLDEREQNDPNISKAYFAVVDYFKRSPSLMDGFMTSEVAYDALPSSIAAHKMFSQIPKLSDDLGKLMTALGKKQKDINPKHAPLFTGGDSLDSHINSQVTGGSRFNRRARLTRKKLNK